MKVDFFSNFPAEIIINILSRLPIRNAISCKLICKSWRDLLQTREFADVHLCNSVSGVATCRGAGLTKIFEFVDETDLDGHKHRYIPVTKFDCDEFVASFILLHGSANGLLLLLGSERRTPYICNPVTREYIQLPNEESVYSFPALVTSGFGVSKVSGQYKVVRIIHDCVQDLNTYKVSRIANCVCDVYTVGTRTWRSIARVPPLGNDHYSIPPFVYGNLHWSVTNFEGLNLISCFDLEIEIFTTFFPPSCLIEREMRFGGALVALKDCLCICESSDDDEIVIWLMKNYGDEKSWSKEFVIKKPAEFIRGYGPFTDVVYPIKVFKDGDILMVWYNLYMFYYSSKTKTTQYIDMFGVYEDGYGFEAMLHCSSFLSLKNTFPTENVSTF